MTAPQYEPGPVTIEYQVEGSDEWFNAGIGDVAWDDQPRCQGPWSGDSPQGCSEPAEFALDEERFCWRHALDAYQSTLLDWHAATSALRITRRDTAAAALSLDYYRA